MGGYYILKLQVSESQKSFVASNDLSIIEAYISITGNGHAFPFGIFDDDIPVGFLMIGFDVDDSYENSPQIAYGNYSLWRFMIDEKYQEKGYGKRAMQLALDFIRTFPCGSAKYCYLSYEPENKVAKKLYEEFGFCENGEMDDEEIVLTNEKSMSKFLDMFQEKYGSPEQYLLESGLSDKEIKRIKGKLILGE